jgi:hypothetical protein
MDARTIKRVDVEAARKVTADTSFGALIPEGILHTTSAVLGSTMSSVGISKQLPFSPFPSMLQLRNKSTAVFYSLQHFTISFHLLDIEHAMKYCINQFFNEIFVV